MMLFVAPLSLNFQENRLYRSVTIIIIDVLRPRLKCDALFDAITKIGLVRTDRKKDIVLLEWMRSVACCTCCVRVFLAD